MLDSLTDTYVYFELTSDINITCNNTVNQNGKLEVDDSGNSLISRIDSGDTPLGKLESYNGDDKLLVYNETTNEMELLAEGDLFKLNIDFDKGVDYYLGAKKVLATRISGFTFSADIGTKNVFKVYLDGKDVKFFTYDATTITVQGVSSARVDDFTKLTVILYDEHAITDSTEFVISYSNYTTIYQQDDFMNLSYFKAVEFNGEDMEMIQSINPNQEVNKTNIRNSFKNADLSIINKVTNTLEVVSYVLEGYIDLADIVGLNNFRIVLINPFIHRCVIFNNCRMDKGINLSYEKEGNTRKYSLDCGNRIEVTVHGELGAYGEGYYGKGLYGTNTSVINSSHIGGNLYD